MNKKVLLGCLGALIVGAVLGGVAFYFFVVQPAKSYVASLASLGEIAELNNQIRNQGTFRPAADRELTQAQVDRFVAVQRELVDRVGDRYQQLDEKYKRYSAGLQEGETPGLGTLLEMWRDLSGSLREVKEFQVQALNSQNFSLEEYRWVKSEFYNALGADVMAVGLDQIAEAIEKQNPEVLTRQKPETPDAPEKSKELVRPYREEATRWLAFAWLGV